MPPRDSFDSYRRFEITFDPRDLEPVTPYSEDLKDEYEETRQALEELRQKEEIIRRKAEQLEEIAQKEEAFVQGRMESIRQIELCLEHIEREGMEAKRLAAECAAAQQRFSHHLTTLRNLRPEARDREKLKIELDHALRQIAAAEEDLAEAEPLIEHCAERQQNRNKNRNRQAAGAPLRHPARREVDFGFWLKAGLIFTLPLVAVAIIVASFFLFIR